LLTDEVERLQVVEVVDFNLALDNFFFYFDAAGESEGEPDEPQTDRSVITM